MRELTIDVSFATDLNIVTSLIDIDTIEDAVFPSMNSGLLIQ